MVAVGLTEMPTSLVMETRAAPPVRVPVPPVNTPVMVALCPAVMVDGVAVRLVIAGGRGFTVTVAVDVTAVAAPLVTVSV